METRSFVILTYLILQTLLPKEVALRKIPDVDEYMIENERTHQRKNYVVQRPFDDEMSSDMDNQEPAFVTDSFYPKTSSEELPAPIVDYANMIRKYIILLDNTVETRTRKRGNVKKYNQVIPETPCTCELMDDTRKFGNNSFPEFATTKVCSQGACPHPYQCKEIIYYISVIKKRDNKREVSGKLPFGLDAKDYVVKQEPIISGCMCARD